MTAPRRADLSRANAIRTRPSRVPPSPARPLRARGAGAMAVFAVLAGGVPLADAGPADAAVLRLSVQGTQTTIWRFTKDQAPTCDWPETGEGEQRIAFATTRSAPGRIRVGLTARGGLRLSNASVEVPAQATLRRTFDRRFAEATPCPDGGTAGGEGAPQNAAGTRRCAMEGAVRLRFGTTPEEVYDPGEPERTGATTPLPRGSVLVRGAPVWPSSALPPTLPAACEARDQGDADVGITQGRGEWAGGIIASRAPLALRRLLRPRKGEKPRPAKVRVKTVVVYPNAAQPQAGPSRTTGRTVLDLTLTFRR